MIGMHFCDEKSCFSRMFYLFIRAMECFRADFGEPYSYDLFHGSFERGCDSEIYEKKWQSPGLFVFELWVGQLGPPGGVFRTRNSRVFDIAFQHPMQYAFQKYCFECISMYLTT